MILIKKGYNWSLENRCSNYNCYAKLEVDREDIYVTIDTDHYKIRYNYTFKCPCCNFETNVEEKLIPSYIKISALEELKKKIGFTKIEH